MLGVGKSEILFFSFTLHVRGREKRDFVFSFTLHVRGREKQDFVFSFTLHVRGREKARYHLFLYPYITYKGVGKNQVSTYFYVFHKTWAE